MVKHDVAELHLVEDLAASGEGHDRMQRRSIGGEEVLLLLKALSVPHSPLPVPLDPVGVLRRLLPRGTSFPSGGRAGTQLLHAGVSLRRHRVRARDGHGGELLGLAAEVRGLFVVPIAVPAVLGLDPLLLLLRRRVLLFFLPLHDRHHALVLEEGGLGGGVGDLGDFALIGDARVDLKQVTSLFTTFFATSPAGIPGRSSRG